MSDNALHAAIRNFAQNVLGKLEEVRSENSELRAKLDAMEARAAELETRSAEVIEGPAGPPGEPGEAGSEGRGIEAAELRGGDLIFRFTDGVEVNVGRVTGEQGERGADGIATREELEAMVEERFADLQARTLADTYVGVWQAGEDYRRGNTATWGGGTWLALADGTDKPGTSDQWKLIVKAGRDGRR